MSQQVEQKIVGRRSTRNSPHKNGICRREPVDCIATSDDSLGHFNVPRSDILQWSEHRRVHNSDGA